MIENLKIMYFLSKMRNPKSIWKSIKTFAGDRKHSAPKTLIHRGEKGTSPKSMSEIINNFYIEKVEIISKRFTDPVIETRTTKRANSKTYLKIHLGYIFLS